MRRFAAVAAIVVVALSPAVALAQSVRSGHSLFFAVGTNVNAADDLNARLRPTYGTFNSTSLDIGGGAYAIWRGVLIGVEGAALKWGSVTTVEAAPASNRHTSLTEGYGALDLGLPFRGPGGLMWYPFAAAGGGGTMFILEDPGSATLVTAKNNPSFTDVVNDPGFHSRLTGRWMLFSVGVGAERFILQQPHGDGVRGLAIGARAGFRIAPSIGDWVLYNLTIPGGPNAGPAGAFVVFTIGPSQRGNR